MAWKWLGSKNCSLYSHQSPSKKKQLLDVVVNCPSSWNAEKATVSKREDYWKVRELFVTITHRVVFCCSLSQKLAPRTGGRVLLSKWSSNRQPSSKKQTCITCTTSHLLAASSRICHSHPNPQTQSSHVYVYPFPIFPPPPQQPTSHLPIFPPQVISFKACFTSYSPIRSTTKWNRTWREAKNSAERIPAMAFWPKAGTPTEATLVDKVGKLRFSWKVGEMEVYRPTSVEV